MFLEEYRGNGSPNYFNLRLVAYAAEALNPLKAKYINIAALKVQIREIKIRTKFPELEDVFISRVESELNQYKDAIDSFQMTTGRLYQKLKNIILFRKRRTIPRLGKTIPLKLPDVYGNGGKPTTQKIIIFRIQSDQKK